MQGKAKCWTTSETAVSVVNIPTAIEIAPDIGFPLALIWPPPHSLSWDYTYTKGGQKGDPHVPLYPPHLYPPSPFFLIVVFSLVLELLRTVWGFPFLSWNPVRISCVQLFLRYKTWEHPVLFSKIQPSLQEPPEFQKRAWHVLFWAKH